MLKILLIEANRDWLIRKEGFQGLEMATAPVGLMSLASFAKEKFGSSVDFRIINSMVDCPDAKDLENALSEYNPDLVGIRGVNIFEQSFHQTARLVKNSRPDVLTVAGGPFVTNDLESALSGRDIDLCVLGEGEVTFSEVIGRVLEKKDFYDIKGIAFRNGKGIVRNSNRNLIEDLDALPFPDYSLINFGNYSRLMGYAFSKKKQAGIFSSRGCPYRCIYCHGIFGRRVRSRSPQNVFQEIGHLYNKFGVREFYIFDDNFNFDYARAMKIFDLIISSRIKINIYFTASIRSDKLDRRFIDRMIQAGTVLVDYNIESASKRLQSYIKKCLDLEKVADAIHYTCNKGIMVGSFIMVGFPTETREEAMCTVEYLKQFKKMVHPQIASVKYYPGTEIYKLAKKEKISLQSLKQTLSGSYHDVSFHQTPLISQKDFKDIALKFLSQVVLSKERLLNALAIQKRFLSQEELDDFYSIYLRRPVKDFQTDVLAYAR